MAQTNVYDPYNWLPSLFRALNEYVKNGINGHVKHGYDEIGLMAYHIVFDFPAALVTPESLPFVKDGVPVTLIHFEIDNIDNRPVGFGFAEIAESIYPDGTITPEEAYGHEISFDVGIWATDESGGSSARLEAYGALDSIFSPASAQEACESLTGGVQIRSFSGGRFLTETVNDVRLYRVADLELVCRVYSTHKAIDATDSEVVQVPELFIDGVVIIDL